MLHYDHDFRRQFASEHAQELAFEMRRGRRLTPTEACYPGWARLRAKLVAHTKQLFHGKGQHAPAYDA